MEPGCRGGGVRETGVGGANSITAANGNLIQPTTLHHSYSLSVFHQQWEGKRRQTSHGMVFCLMGRAVNKLAGTVL